MSSIEYLDLGVFPVVCNEYKTLCIDYFLMRLKLEWRRPQKPREKPDFSITALYYCTQPEQCLVHLASSRDSQACGLSQPGSSYKLRVCTVTSIARVAVSVAVRTAEVLQGSLFVRSCQLSQKIPIAGWFSLALQLQTLDIETTAEPTARGSDSINV